MTSHNWINKDFFLLYTHILHSVYIVCTLCCTLRFWDRDSSWPSFWLRLMMFSLETCFQKCSWTNAEQMKLQYKFATFPRKTDRNKGIDCHFMNSVLGLFECNDIKNCTYWHVTSNHMISARSPEFAAELDVVDILKRPKENCTEMMYHPYTLLDQEVNNECYWRTMFTFNVTWINVFDHRTFSLGIFFFAHPSQIIGYLGQISSWACENIIW